MSSKKHSSRDCNARLPLSHADWNACNCLDIHIRSLQPHFSISRWLKRVLMFICVTCMFLNDVKGVWVIKYSGLLIRRILNLSVAFPLIPSSFKRNFFCDRSRLKIQLASATGLHFMSPWRYLVWSVSYWPRSGVKSFVIFWNDKILKKQDISNHVSLFFRSFFFLMLQLHESLAYDNLCNRSQEL